MATTTAKKRRNRRGVDRERWAQEWAQELEWAPEFAQCLRRRDSLIARLGEDEAEGEAVYALWRATETYRPSRGEFYGYARVVIRRHLRTAARWWCGLGRNGPRFGLAQTTLESESGRTDDRI